MGGHGNDSINQRFPIRVKSAKCDADRNRSGRRFSSAYALVIGNDGFYGIGKMEEGEFEFLTEGKDTTGVILGGDALNKLRADCRGETLRLTVNGKQLAEFQDDDYPAGAVGLMAGTRKQDGLQAWFDDFAIFQP